MPLNLISDAWIPVLDKAGQRRILAPWQMADDSLLRPDWPRADLNIACLELLIGLIFLADPPANLPDWEARLTPDPERLRDRLAAFAPAFNLTGDGPLFLQDLEPLQGEANPADMLFIDSAGANTAKNNADLMVHRGRYPALEPALAAMALYAFQAHAPSGGAGNRTSMRGGGPLLTLVDPGQGLWSLIWANQPHGKAGEMRDLPWMRATRVSDQDQPTTPPTGGSYGVEAFFGMPRRLRLLESSGLITGVVQKPYGTKYVGWLHPLTPYRRKAQEELAFAEHPRAGLFGYRHWLGVLTEKPSNSDKRERAHVLKLWRDRARVMGVEGSVQVAGWAMDNMKPRDFTHSVQPVVALEPEANDMLIGLVEAAEQASRALANALKAILQPAHGKENDDRLRDAEREAFYSATETPFRACFAELKAGVSPDQVAKAWLKVLKRQALSQFDALAMPELYLRETDVIERIVTARDWLAKAFFGDGKYGGPLFDALVMEKPVKKKGKAA